MIHCANHPERSATYHCPRCEKGFCAECVKVRPFKHTSVIMCARCSNSLTDLSPYIQIMPFWKNLRNVFTVAFTEYGPVMMAVFVALATMLRTLYGYVFFAEEFENMGMESFWRATIMVAYSTFFSFMIPYFYLSVSWVEDGRFGLPRARPGTSPLQDFGLAYVRLFVAALGMFWPLVLIILSLNSVYYWPDVWVRYVFLSFFLVVGGIYFSQAIYMFPMSLLIQGVFKSGSKAFDLRFISSQVQKIKDEYRRAFAVIAGIFIVYALARTALHALLPEKSFSKYVIYHVLFYVVDGAAHVYMLITVAYLMGYLSYQTRYKLKWWRETEEEPTFRVDGKPTTPFWSPGEETYGAGVALAAAAVAKSGRDVAAGPGGAAPPEAGRDLGRDIELSEKVMHGNYLIEHGSFDQAKVLFAEVLAADPENLGGLRGIMVASYHLGDQETVKKYGRELARDFVRQYALEALFDMYEDYRKTIPDFTFDPPELMAVADWAEKAGKPLEAARMLREYGVLYKDDPRAAEALYRCGEILMMKCAMRENAANVLSALIERYPDSEHAARAAELLKGGPSRTL